MIWFGSFWFCNLYQIKVRAEFFIDFELKFGTLNWWYLPKFLRCSSTLEYTSFRSCWARTYHLQQRQREFLWLEYRFLWIFSFQALMILTFQLKGHRKRSNSKMNTLWMFSFQPFHGWESSFRLQALSDGWFEKAFILKIEYEFFTFFIPVLFFPTLAAMALWVTKVLEWAVQRPYRRWGL